MSKLWQWWRRFFGRPGIPTPDPDTFREQFKVVMYSISEAFELEEDARAYTIAMEYFGRRYWQHMIQVVKL